MERKIEFDEKIKVFISSKCGVEKYDKIRAKLKKAIENTGFAKVYLFEGEGSSTLTAKQHYLYGVDDSDICIFLIDNTGKVPQGVLREHQRVKAHPKKTLYIFCNKNQEEITSIQKEIMGPGGPKYYVVDSFDEFINIGYQSLINDIGNIYISYCKGRLIDPNFESPSASIEEINNISSESLSKQIYKDIDITKKIISNEIFNESINKVEKTCDLDTYASEFLNVMLGKKTIKEFNLQFLLLELKNLQSEKLYKVVCERWNAIQYYYFNDLKKAIEYEDKALNIARENNLPNWIIQDILIDLKNLYRIKAQEENQYFINNDAQKELDNEESALFYPLLDRYDREFYREIIKSTSKDSMKSPYTVSFGNNINKYSNYISSIYIISVFNGSLTHLVKIIGRIKEVAFHLCSQYDNWEFRVLLLKMALVDGNKKEIKNIIKFFNDVYGKMNGEDSKKIYEFTKGIPIEYKRNTAQLLAFQNLGYYFDDDFYLKVWDDVYDIIIKWLESDNRIVIVGEYFFDAIIDNLLRINNNKVIENILIKIFDFELKRFYDKTLSVIERMDLTKVSEENIEAINNRLIILIEDKDERKNYLKLKKSIISIVKQVPKQSYDLDNAVMKNLYKFYKNTYSLEISIGTQIESEGYILKYIDEIKERNKTQGKNGCYKGYMDNPYKTIERIIVVNDVDLDCEMTSLIISACQDTLYAEKQTLSAKKYAFNLLTFIRLISNENMYNFKSLINQLINDENIILMGRSDILEKSSKSTLYFNFIMMKLVFNKVKVEDLMGLFGSYSELEKFEKLEALKTILSIFENKENDYIDKEILLLILQFALTSTNDSNHDVRFFATKSLLNLISEDNKDLIMDRFSSMMDYDSVFIKSQIINFSEKLKDLDEVSFRFIKEKAMVDNNFVIRQRANLL